MPTWRGMRGRFKEVDSWRGSVTCFIRDKHAPVGTGDDAADAMLAAVKGDGRWPADGSKKKGGTRKPCDGSIHTVSSQKFKLDTNFQANEAGASSPGHPCPKQDATILTLKNFFSDDECDALYAAAKPHFRSTHSTFPVEYRNNDRALVEISQETATMLFKRALSVLSADDIKDVHPMCFGHGGVWYPLSVNRVCKVSESIIENTRNSEEDSLSHDDRPPVADGYFARHRDAPWIPREDQASIFTILVYLADTDTGGETILYPECDSKGCTVMGAAEQAVGPELSNHSGGSAVTGTEPGIVEHAAHFIFDMDDKRDKKKHFKKDAANKALAHCIANHQSVKIRPQKGKLLIFPHHLPHGALPVLKGRKVVFKTELIFRRVSSSFLAPYKSLSTSRCHHSYMDEANYSEARRLYEESQQVLTGKEVAASAADRVSRFVDLFHQVVEMQTEAMRKTPSPDALIASRSSSSGALLGPRLTSQDVVLEICDFLNPLEVVRNVMMSSLSLHFTILRSGYFWRRQVELCYPYHYQQQVASVTQQNNAYGDPDGTVAWFDAFRLLHLNKTALRPSTLVVFPSCIVVRRTAECPDLQERTSTAGILAASVAQRVSKDDAPHNTSDDEDDGYDEECWYDIHGDCIHSSRLPEEGCSIYHFHIPDDERFSSGSDNDDDENVVAKSPFKKQTGFAIKRTEVVRRSGADVDVAWAPVGRALQRLSTFVPSSSQHATTRATVSSLHHVHGSAPNTPPPVLIVTHPLQLELCNCGSTGLAAQATARELLECGGVSQVSFVHPAVAALYSEVPPKGSRKKGAGTNNTFSSQLATSSGVPCRNGVVILRYGYLEHDVDMFNAPDPNQWLSPDPTWECYVASVSQGKVIDCTLVNEKHGPDSTTAVAKALRTHPAMSTSSSSVLQDGEQFIVGTTCFFMGSDVPVHRGVHESASSVDPDSMNLAEQVAAVEDEWVALSSDNASDVQKHVNFTEQLKKKGSTLNRQATKYACSDDIKALENIVNHKLCSDVVKRSDIFKANRMICGAALPVNTLGIPRFAASTEYEERRIFSI